MTDNASTHASSHAPSQAPSQPNATKPPFKERLAHEIRTHPFGYSVLAAFVVLGPVLAVMIFPQAPPAAAAIGGLAFGVYAALCTVPQKFM